MEQKIQTLRDSASIRWTALLLLALAMFCSYIFMDILSPIKDLMQSTRGWDSTAFGTMQGSETFLNVFVFFLIFAGIILDKMGVAVRSGQMCAEPLMNRFGVTGMLRVSFAPYNTVEEAEYFVKCLDRAIGMLM